jgi:choline dehydrogenase
MTQIIKTAALLLPLTASVHSVGVYDSDQPHLRARKLLGTSFGVRNINRTFDYIVVGGGDAGLTVAARLSEDPTKLVAVIEAGSCYEIYNGNFSQIPNFDVYWDGKDKDDINPRIDWGFTTTPKL